MASETEIANLALSHLGIGKEISNIDTERSDEANASRRFYQICRDTVLRDFKWPFATKVAELALVEEDPTTEWAYSYTYPTDCLMARRILSGVRNDSRQSRVPYTISYGTASKVIFTDIENAELEYTVKVTDSQRFPDDFVLALSYKLAAVMAPRLTSGDPFKLGVLAANAYDRFIKIAAANSYNEEQQDEVVESEFVRYREGDPS
jgi:hypothetical protein